MSGALPISPQVIAEWMPFAKAAGFFLATFVLEDVAAVGAGLLLATGQISWPAAFTACFLGIWMGDAGLYAVARWAGRSWFERSSLHRFAAKVADSERWFAARGATILIFSRMVPGARLPTYLAAGFLRLPLPRFLFVTGTASGVWTIFILWLAQAFGERISGWLARFRHGGVILALLAVGLFIGLQLLRRTLARLEIPKLRAGFARWRHWEFWPAWLFYPPVAVYCLWLALKYRGLTLPTAANPGIFSGGLVGESKLAMLKELFATSPEFTAEAELITGETLDERVAALKQILERFQGAGTPGAREIRRPRAADIEFDVPIILKPDLGQRGAGFKLVARLPEATDYLRLVKAPVIAQRYAPGPFEIGVFYYRFPHEPRGHIFAMTEKIFPKLVGDGRSTVAELIQRDPRAALISHIYLRRFSATQHQVLAEGEVLRLVKAGNHAQGCIFRDGMKFWSPQLEARIDEISQRLGGFFIGRYDIRYASEADLRAGKNLQIIELNGAASEATNIYDSRNSLWAAYRTLFRQWDLVFAIGAANRTRGIVPTRFSLVWKTWRMYSNLAATYPMAD